MSDEAAMADIAASKEAVSDGDGAAKTSATDAQGSIEVSASASVPQQMVEFSVECKVEIADSEPSVSRPASTSDFETEDKRGQKRRASTAFNDDAEAEQFKGFETSFVEPKDVSLNRSRILERLEAELEADLEAAKKAPIKGVRASLAAKRASKRPRQDTDASRPSSGLSSRSEGESALSGEGANSSPAHRGRRPPPEINSPLFRVPLEKGWKRELVYRAALDAHSKRNADIYYYTPKGKKLRSSREVSEHLSGTGLTLENFSFFKEPLGVDDPEKEIIRDAKFVRRLDSPSQSPATTTVEGKRTPKPKPPKGASLDEVTSPPAKIKVKSLGSRLSGSGSGPSPAAKKKTQNADNNNSAAWKKPRQTPPEVPGPPLGSGAPDTSERIQVPTSAPSGQVLVLSGTSQAGQVSREATSAPPPPPLLCRPPLDDSPEKAPPQVVQPCSLTCGLGVPELACGVCLCLFHPLCANYAGPNHLFTCKNCHKSSSPLEPPPLLHKSGALTTMLSPPVPRLVPARPDRVLLRMKVAGGPDGERVWAVAKPTQTVTKHTPAPLKIITPPVKTIPAPVKPIPPPVKTISAPVKPITAPVKTISAPVKPIPAPVKPTQAPKTQVKPKQVPRLNPLSTAVSRPSLPQSLASLNGKRFIVVPRSVVQPSTKPDDKKRGRLSNGAVTSPEAAPAKRRTRQKDETDYFTPFTNKAKNVVVQIFQYLGMRDLAHAARVSRLWREMAAAPQLWKHVRMKNSHVSDWAGLCSALKRHGTRRLDLRKLLLPPSDDQFWDQFAQHIPKADTLERIEMCRCPARAVEAVSRGLPNLRSLSALAIRDALLDPSPLGALSMLHELRLKSMSGLSLSRDLRPLTALKYLQHLSLTSIKELGWCCSDVIEQLQNLESLELGECTFKAEFATVLAKLHKLRRLRLERGTAQCAAPALLRALAGLPLLTRLELVNIDIKVGFDDALAECKNIQRLLIIPTYVSQSATTNRQVLSGVLRLKDTLTHLLWGVTIELLRVTELFIDQCEKGQRPHKDVGECIPVLKPVPGCKPDNVHMQGQPQVEILPLPTLQSLLTAQMPTTKLKLLRIPFHATWRQSLADFQ